MKKGWTYNEEKCTIMSIDINNFKAHFVRKETPALKENGILGGCADIEKWVRAGTALKTGPGISFFRRRVASESKHARCVPVTCLKRAKSVSRFIGWAVMGVMFGE